jgi:hypothetical protein
MKLVDMISGATVVGDIGLVDVVAVSALSLAFINFVRVWVKKGDAENKNNMGEHKRVYRKNPNHPYWAQGRTAYRKKLHNIQTKRKYTKDLSNPRWAK